MKSLSSKRLFIFCFLLLSTHFVKAQETEIDTINKVKKGKIFPIYMSINGGIATTNEVRYFDIYNLVNGSIGYRINCRNAIGIAQSNFLVDNEIRGLVGIEYRYTPVRRMIFSAELGAIRKVIFGPIKDGSFQYEYLPNQSQRFYCRLTAGFRFWQIFSINFNFLQTGESVFMQKKWMELSPVDRGYKDVGIIRNENHLFIWSLGINLPIVKY
jgi:hypothetical protein